MNRPLRIPAGLLIAITEHAEAAAPAEACGILSGPDGPWPPDVYHEMRNVSDLPDQFAFDPHDQIRLWHQLERGQREVKAVVHSHPRHSAVLSPADLQYIEVDMPWVVVSLRDKQTRAWLAGPDGGPPAELPIEIL